MESNPRRLLTSSDQTGSQVASDGGLAVWPSGKALGWLAEGPRFESASAVFSPQTWWPVDRHCLVTLSLTINDIIKWLSSLPILMQEPLWW